MQKSWVASEKQGSLISGATVGQLKSLLGARRKFGPVTNRLSHSNLKAAIPDSFDASLHWKNCTTIMNIRDQSACGSCWAVAAAETISDRYCTVLGATDKYRNVEVSAAYLMSCCDECGMGCGGGFPDSAMQYWASNGLPLESCDPYPFPKCEHHIPQKHYPVCPKNEYPTPQCQTTCKNGQSPTMYLGTTSYSLSGEEDFQKELMTKGPIEVTFDVYADFPTYKSGVYKHVTGAFLGGHAVKLVGWGATSTGEKYWIINNSWNVDWGMNGQFWIARGDDECGIEDSGSAGLPKAF
jgi:cysteine peptidase C